MSWCDGDAPAAYHRSRRVARKEHPCCECQRKIGKGGHYWDHSGVWDGGWRTYRRCLRCERLAIKVEVRARLGPYEGVAFGSLREAIFDLGFSSLGG